MGVWIKRLQLRELRFLGLIAITVLLMALHLSSGLHLADQEGSGWRKIDLEALQRRIETGELREREADWYHPATPGEIRPQRGGP